MMTDADDIREALDYYVRSGYRDDDGVWHETGRKVLLMAALDRLDAARAQRDTLAEAVDNLCRVTDALRRLPRERWLDREPNRLVFEAEMKMRAAFAAVMATDEPTSNLRRP